MTGPQIEDGYTRIANEILERAPMFKLNGTQLRIILIIWRYTYGFKRKSHEFSITFFAEALGVNRSQVDRELTALIDRNVVQVIDDSTGPKPRSLTFNKNYSEWVESRCTRNGGQENSVRQNEDKLSAKKSTIVSAKKRTKKERKKTLKKDMSSLSIYEQIIGHLNSVADKRFNSKSKANQKLINGRISEGRTVEDFIYVIDTKCSHWMDDPKMNEYLRPATLFAQKNFENYINQKPKVVNEQPADFRDKEIAFQKWIEEENDPDGFDWT